MKLLLVVSVLLGISGCGSRSDDVLDAQDFFKAIEGKLYDAAAEMASDYCRKVTLVDSPILTEERIEARREIRQRGDNGPGPVDLPFLDEQTSRGEGPVIRIWCEGETVPIEVWQDFVKIL